MILVTKETLSNYSYTMVMTFSAFITTLKLIFFANYVEVESFNAYVIPLGLGSFLAFVLSLGLVESTTKIFSRLYQENKNLIILSSFKYIVPILIKRSVFLVSLIMILTFFTSSNSFFLGLVVVFVATSMAISTLLASMQRSSLKTTLMANTALLRALLSILAIFTGYKISPNYGPIIGEIISQLISIFVGYCFLIKSHSLTFKKIFNTTKEKIINSVKQNNELKLFLFIAYLIMSVPLYLDRYYFELIYPLKEMSPYTLCAIFLGGSYLIFNTLYQRIGPLMIIRFKSGTPLYEIINTAFKTSIAGTSILLIIFISLLFLYFQGFAEKLFVKYEVSLEMLVTIFLISILNCTSIFEGIFLSLDRENKFFMCSCFYLSLLILLISSNFYLNFSLLFFLKLYFFIKLAHLIFMIALLYSFAKAMNNKASYNR